MYKKSVMHVQTSKPIAFCRSGCPRRRPCVSYLMMSVERRQKFHTGDGLFEPISLVVRPIRRTTQIWLATRHQYWISALVPQTSFRGETTGGVTNCCLFQAKTNRAASQKSINIKVSFRKRLNYNWYHRKIMPKMCYLMITRKYCSVAFIGVVTP